MANKLDTQKIIGLNAISIIVIAIIFKMIADIAWDNQIVLISLSFINIVLCISAIYSLKNLTGSYFSITVMFTILFSLFMFGQSFTYVIGVNEAFLSNKFTFFQSVDGISDAQIFLGCFVFGVFLSKKRFVHEHTYRYDSNGVKIGYWIVCLSLPFELWVTITKIVISMTFGYAALYQDIAYNLIPSSFKILSYFFLPGIWYLYFCSKKGTRAEKIALILLIYVCLSYLLMGYRAMAILPVLLYLYAKRIKEQNETAKRTNSKKQILIYSILAIIILFVFPAVRYSRNSGGLEKMDSSMFNEFVSNNEIFATINDMGKSIQTVIYTKEVVPQKEDYRYGYTYIIASSVALPNLFWDKHPAEVYGSLGRWITKIVDPEFYDFGGALGYSCVAESYVNFGYVGLIIFPIILGFLLIKTEKFVYRINNPVYYASMAIVAFYILFYPRGEFSEIVRGIVWYMLLPLLVYKIINKTT